MSSEVLFVNESERRGLSILFGLVGLLAAVATVQFVVGGELYGVVGAGIPALASAGLVVRVWHRDTLSLEAGEVVVRGIWRTQRIELVGTTWGVVPSYVGMIERVALAVVDRDGGGRDLSRQGIWTPRRGRQAARLEAVAALLNERAEELARG